MNAPQRLAAAGHLHGTGGRSPDCTVLWDSLVTARPLQAIPQASVMRAAAILQSVPTQNREQNGG